MSAITYKNVDHLLVIAVPELAEVRKAGLIHSGSKHEGQYVLFMDFDPLIDQIIDSGGSNNSIDRLFDFFEQMALSEDLEVVNLLWIAVLERLLGNPNRLARAWKFMGPATRKLTRKIARKLNRQAIIPGRFRELFRKTNPHREN